MPTVTRARVRAAERRPESRDRQTKPTKRVSPVRRIAAEIVGTYFLVIAAAGIDMVAELHPAEVSGAARAVAPAFVVAAMIYALGSVSGAHFNPAVTVAFATRRVFPWRWVPVYIAAQLAAAVAAAATLHLLLSPIGHEGTNYPHGGVGQSLGFEILLAGLLVTVILNTATQHRLLGPDAALPVGGTIAACGLVGMAISGASMNPARSLGPAIVGGIGRDQWIYVVGPLVGALLALVITAACHGAPKVEERDAAEGSENR